MGDREDILIRAVGGKEDLGQIREIRERRKGGKKKTEERRIS